MDEQNIFDACECGNLERVKGLLNQGVDIDSIGGKWRELSPLLYASSGGHNEMVKELLNPKGKYRD